MGGVGCVMGLSIHLIGVVGWVVSFLSFCVVEGWFVCRSQELVCRCGRDVDLVL